MNLKRCACAVCAFVCLTGCSETSAPTPTPPALELPGNQSSGLLGEVIKDLQGVLATPDEKYADDLHYWQEVNSDVCAMISIPEYGTYEPVVDAEESNMQWLRTSITGEYSVAGCVFLDVRCDLENTPVKLVHGHNMSDGTMFAKVPNYLTLDSCEDAPIIEFYTEDGKLTYQVFSVISVNSKEEALPIDTLASLEDVSAMTDELLERSLVPDGEVTSQDILVLNTCWYGESGVERNLHCVVSASRI